MKPDELRALVNQTKWLFLGKGAFNSVGVSKHPFTIGNYTGLWVYKTQPKNQSWSEASLAVSKWSVINPDLPAYRVGNGWVAPYVGDQQANDFQIATELVEIYRRTRLIIVDAFIKKNMLEHKGQVVCVDVDYAISRDPRSVFREIVDLEDFRACFKDHEKQGYSQSITIIKNLYFLENCLRIQGISNQWLSYKVISSLTGMRQHHQSIGERHLALIKKMHDFDTDGVLDKQFFQPYYIKRLFNFELSNNLQTKDQLFQVIGNLLIEKYNPEQLIIKNNSKGLKFLLEQAPGYLAWIDHRGFNLLHLASYHERLKLIPYLIAMGLSIEALTLPAGRYSEMTPLEIAMHRNQFKCAQLLLNLGAQLPERIANSPLYLFYAARQGKLALVKSLVQANPDWIRAVDNFNQNALIWAASKGRNAVVSYLLAEGADRLCRTKSNSKHKNHSAMDWAIVKRHIRTIQLLKRAEVKANHFHSRLGSKSLFNLIENNKLRQVTILLDHNPLLVHVFQDGKFSPLHVAIHKGYLSIVTLLIERGARLDETINAQDHQFNLMTPLELAIHRGHIHIVRYLLKKNAEIPSFLKAEKAMLFAAEYGLFVLVKHLIITNKRLVQVRNEYNQSPLTLAAAQGHNLIVAFLVQHGAELNLVVSKVSKPYHSSCASKYRNPLDLAIENQHETCMDILLEAGAEAHFYSGKERIINIKASRYSLFQPSKTTESYDPRPSCSSSFQQSGC